ncbi:putative ATP-dependent RNA helicase DHR1, partial [Coelomomyces lativittatus]
MKTPSSSLSSLPSSSHLSPPTPSSTLTVPEITSKVPFHVQTLAGVETHPPALLSEKQVPLDSSTSTRRKLFVIPHRTETMQEQRMKLPVCQEEFRIMECIEEHPVVIICGETGSGKTTQVPQFLYEAGYGHPKSDYPKLIGVTQPRRVAAIAMSQRVGTELNAPELVSYQVRFEKNITASSKIHFMTDGVLLRELSQDLFLSNYSVIVLDEAHERNLNTDVLIGLLSRVVTHRSKLFQEWKLKSELAKKARQPIPPQLHFPLKLILMSATLRVSDFTDNQKLFPTSPPVIHIETRQFPVTLHFSRITPQDHVLEAFKKVCEIHAESPPGGILVFLTGQTEIYELIKKLKNKFQKKMKSSTSTSLPSRRRPPSSSSFSLDPLSSIEDQLLELDTGLLDFTHVEQPDEDGRINDEEQEESETEVMDFELSQRSSTHPHRQRNALGLVSSTQKKSTLARIPSDSEDLDEASTLLVLPLYSLLSSEEQMKVFDTVPEGTRLCVVATNVAETSLTIPGIRYVIDSGKCKTKVYDPITGAESFHKTWISKASADQRFHFPLKLILMSATLRVSDFTDNQKLFPTSPPVIHIETRQFPVTLHFSRITPQDHVLEAFKKVCEIHAESPPGGILVFLTGQTEIYELIKKLKNKFQKKMKSSTSTSLPSRRRPPSSSSFSLDPLSSIEDQLLELDTGLLDFTHVEQPDEDGRINDEEQEESETEVMDFELSQRSSTHPHRQRNALGLVSSTQKKSTLARIPSDSEDLDEASTLLVLPLYSLLSSEEQMKVFDTVPEGTRLCVVATNVAETSLTIPGIRYVIDSGKCKTKVYDPITGAESFHKTWISKASADQRLGRAGRSGPGQCYRLYSSSVFDRFFPLHTAPEILTMPMESVILHLKAMHIDCIHHFPFPTSPKLEDIVKAEKVLQKLGAFNPHHSISSLGLQMSRFPVHPRFAKILLLAMQQELIVYAIVIVAILSVGDLFLSSEESSQRQEEMGTAVSSVTPVSS